MIKVQVLLVMILLSTAGEAFADFDFAQTDVMALFNQYRVGQAKIPPWPGIYWPFEGHGGGAGIDHTPVGQDMSPAQKYDKFFGLGTATADWEEQHHNCEKMDPSLQPACKAWYGHCNGWTGAAINNPELSYTVPITVTNPDTQVTMTFNYMDIKALLTEAWLDVWATYEGTGTAVRGGDWIFDPTSDTAKAPSRNNSKISNYDAYWDVTPRALFFALTNYVGALQQGLAMDRFTGSQIWNQPVAGYRLLPIEGNPDKPIQQGGASVYPVTFGVKIYWANDSVSYDFKRTVSLNWDVKDPQFSNDNVPANPADPKSQDQVSDNAYLSRYLSFTLFFDGPVTVSPDKTTILTAGKLVGDGVWTHADPSLKSTWYPGGFLDFQAHFENDQTHPDFLWRPDHLTDASYRNPNIDPVKIYKYILPDQGKNVQSFLDQLTQNK